MMGAPWTHRACAAQVAYLCAETAAMAKGLLGLLLLHSNLILRSLEAWYSSI